MKNIFTQDNQVEKKRYARPWVVLRNRIKKKNSARIVEFFDSISAPERARAISRLDNEEQADLFFLLSPKQAAELLQDLPGEQAAYLIGNVSTPDAAAIVHHLPENEQADILGDLSSGTASEAILKTMDPDQAQATRTLLGYKENTAGAIMGTEFLSYYSHMTIGEVVDDLGHNSEKYSDYNVQYVYIVDNDRKLKGVLRLRDLLLCPRTKPLAEIMRTDPLSVNVNTSLDKLIEIFEECGYVGIPAVDQQDRLAGIVKRYEVMEAAGERQTDNYLKASGIIGGEELRSMPILLRSRRRLSWLSINIFLNIIAASVIAFYQDTLASVIALAVFLPIISDMSGCSGNQAVAVSIRELTLGIVKPVDMLRILLKEFGVGIINGIVLGLLLGVVAFLWKGNFYLGLVVGGALAVNTIVAVCIGGMVPLLLQQMKKDPALASGPILTTVTDMCGFFFALGFATLLLPFLT